MSSLDDRERERRPTRAEAQLLWLLATRVPNYAYLLPFLEEPPPMSEQEQKTHDAIVAALRLVDLGDGGARAARRRPGGSDPPR